MNSFSDNALMQKVKAGDLDKLGLLYERHNKILFGYFYRITSNSESSEDLVHNVFLRILKYRDKFRGEGKFYTWMFHIAHNIAADYFNKEKNRKYTDDIADHDLRDPACIDEELFKKEQQHMLRTALKKLNDDQREVLVLSRYQNLKYKEIAEILNCSEGAVKVRIFRALDRLSQIFSKLEN